MAIGAVEDLRGEQRHNDDDHQATQHHDLPHPTRRHRSEPEEGCVGKHQQCECGDDGGEVGELVRGVECDHTMEGDEHDGCDQTGAAEAQKHCCGQFDRQCQYRDQVGPGRSGHGIDGTNAGSLQKVAEEQRAAAHRRVEERGVDLGDRCEHVEHHEHESSDGNSVIVEPSEQGACARPQHRDH